jgi:deoxyribodipyrimidine photolyase
MLRALGSVKGAWPGVFAPEPIVDHKQERQEALRRYGQIN